MSITFTRKMRELSRCASILLNNYNWKRFSDDYKEDEEELEKLLDEYPDYCSMSCSGEPFNHFIELCRQVLHTYKAAKRDHKATLILEGKDPR